MDVQNYAMTRLRDACKHSGPLCVGLDTDPSYIPCEVLRLFDSPAEAVLAYNLALIEACGPWAGCFKVQIAYYEALGLAGLEVYAKTLQAVRSAGYLAIADVKRGDIADTARAYARAHFEGDFEADIITLNPYMGFETLDPFLEYIHTARKGVFVLLRTSNPGMKDIEWLELSPAPDSASAGRSDTVVQTRVLDVVGDALHRIGSRYISQDSSWVSPVGAVVGCTQEDDARTLRDRYPEIFFLIPGYGAQGGAARIAATLLSKAGGTVNSSRGILMAWAKDPSLEIRRTAGELFLADLVKSAERAAFAAKAELLGAVTALGN